MKTNIRYRANDGKFAKTHTFELFGWLFLAVLMALLAISAYEWYQKPLLSPEADKLSFVPQVQAAEPKKTEITISCEDPRGYLECQVHKGKISWSDYNKLYRIVNECENRSWDPNATYVNRHKDGSISTDRGIFMVNDKYHPKLSNQQAFNFKSNIDYAIKLYKAQGTTPWVCAKKLNIK